MHFSTMPFEKFKKAALLVMNLYGTRVNVEITIAVLFYVLLIDNFFLLFLVTNLVLALSPSNDSWKITNFWIYRVDFLKYLFAHFIIGRKRTILMINVVFYSYEMWKTFYCYYFLIIHNFWFQYLCCFLELQTTDIRSVPTISPPPPASPGHPPIPVQTSLKSPVWPVFVSLIQ